MRGKSTTSTSENILSEVGPSRALVDSTTITVAVFGLYDVPYIAEGVCLSHQSQQTSPLPFGIVCHHGRPSAYQHFVSILSILNNCTGWVGKLQDTQVLLSWMLFAAAGTTLALGYSVLEP